MAERLSAIYVAPSTPAPRGLLRPGNIDLAKRPIIQNPDGSTSTVYSMGFGLGDGSQVIVPGVDNKRQLTPEEAWVQYGKTGQHLGVFSGREESDRYASQLHQDFESGALRGIPNRIKDYGKK